MHSTVFRSQRLLWAIFLASPLAGMAAANPDSLPELPLFASGFDQILVTAATCSATDVQAALSSAPVDAIVSIPAGDCDWGASQVSRSGGVVLRGAGSAQTVIRRTAPVVENAPTFLLSVDCGSGASAEVYGIGLIGNDDLQTEAQRLDDVDNGLILRGRCHDFRVHHMAFSKFSNAGLTLRGAAQRGVVYGNTFNANFKCQPAPVSCLGYGVAIYGDGTQPALSLGSAEAVFVEDNTFYDNRHGVASNYGSRYVVRNNMFTSTQRTRNFAMIDAHGRQSGTTAGSRSWEIYSNTLRTDPPSMIAAGIGLRGGDGVVFGNDLGLIPHVAWLSNEICSGAYPVADQIRAAYFWGNVWQPIAGYGSNAIEVTSGCEPYLVENRDWYQAALPGYQPYPYPHVLQRR